MEKVISPEGMSGEELCLVRPLSILKESLQRFFVERNKLSNFLKLYSTIKERKGIYLNKRLGFLVFTTLTI